MVSGGSSKLVSVELLHINGSNICSLPDLPAARSEHTQNGPLLCGGRAGSGNVMGTCVNFCDGSWDQSHSLEHHAGRTSHVSWASPGGLMMIGGHVKQDSALLSDDGTSTKHWGGSAGLPQMDAAML